MLKGINKTQTKEYLNELINPKTGIINILNIPTKFIYRKNKLALYRQQEAMS